jgi:hypothetical protein
MNGELLTVRSPKPKPKILKTLKTEPIPSTLNPQPKISNQVTVVDADLDADALYTPNPKFENRNPKPQTPNLNLQTPSPKHQTPNTEPQSGLDCVTGDLKLPACSPWHPKFQIWCPRIMDFQRINPKPPSRNGRVTGVLTVRSPRPKP